MKKILALFILLVPFCAFATDMCARDDTIVLVFDPLVGGSGGSNANEWTWWTAFPYGRIAGDATCLSAAEAKKTPVRADAGLHGVDADGNVRTQCWCRMTQPVFSGWVFTSADHSAETCATACAPRCPYYVANIQGARKSLFDSIGL